MSTVIEKNKNNIYKRLPLASVLQDEVIFLSYKVIKYLPQSKVLIASATTTCRLLPHSSLCSSILRIFVPDVPSGVNIPSFFSAQRFVLSLHYPCQILVFLGSFLLLLEEKHFTMRGVGKEREKSMWLMLGKNFGVSEIDFEGEKSFSHFCWKTMRLPGIGRLIFKDILTFISHALLKRLTLSSDLKFISTSTRCPCTTNF